jgi:hypothetical protein
MVDSNFQFFKFAYVPRECNRVADALAEQGVGCVWGLSHSWAVFQLVFRLWLLMIWQWLSNRTYVQVKKKAIGCRACRFAGTQPVGGDKASVRVDVMNTII